MRLRSIVHDALAATTALWPPVRKGYAWFHKVAHTLKNQQGLSGAKVGKQLGGLLGTIRRDSPRKGHLAHATRHFLKVTASYWKGLFHCYDVPDLPRTNNDLEHLFGSNRYHERRSTGRKSASPAMVLRGPVRLLAATATRLKPPAASQLAPTDLQAWRELRKALDERRTARTLRRRFRKDPETYLQQIEDALLQPTLPP
jgi:hypothetical protein